MNPKPEITISTTDADRLDRLLASLPRAAFPGRAALEAELARANVVEPHEVPPTVVTMNSAPRLTAVDSGEEFELTLVYPRTPMRAARPSRSWRRWAALLAIAGRLDRMAQAAAGGVKVRVTGSPPASAQRHR
jgi:hypothetical protein